MTPSKAPAHAYHPWTTYIRAREEARRRGDRRVGTEHLLLGLVADPAIASLLGVTLESARQALEALDRQALAAVGIASGIHVPALPERETPPRPTLRAVLQDRVPMTPAAKAALEQAGRPMRRGRRVTPEEVLSALLRNEPPDPAAALLHALGVDVAAARRALPAPPGAA